MSDQSEMEIRCLGCGEIQSINEDYCPNCDFDEEAYVAACQGAPNSIQPGAVKAMADALDRVTKEYIAERDTLYDCSTNAEGDYCGDEESKQAVAEMDEIIDQCRAALRLYHGSDQ